MNLNPPEKSTEKNKQNRKTSINNLQLIQQNCTSPLTPLIYTQLFHNNFEYFSIPGFIHSSNYMEARRRVKGKQKMYILCLDKYCLSINVLYISLCAVSVGCNNACKRYTPVHIVYYFMNKRTTIYKYILL